MATVRNDYSAGKPTLPVVGSPFAASGPYASFVLLATVPLNSNRANINVQNNAITLCAVVIDDGSAAIGAAPAGVSVFSLAVASAAGGQGGSWSSPYEKGRIQVYGTAGAQTSIFEESKSI